MKNNTLHGIHNTSKELCEDGVITCGNLLPYNLLDFKSDVVDFDFMVNSLSKINRYNGHNQHKNGYTVAQHSVIMAQSALLCYGNVNLALQCLYHDLPEAYTSDMVKPMKVILGDNYAKIEENIEKTVFEEIGIEFPFDPRVKEIDKNIAQFEMSIVLHDSEEVHGLFDVWSSEKSKTEFYNLKSILLNLQQYSNKEVCI